jgi:hypothetical protein
MSQIHIIPLPRGVTRRLDFPFMDDEGYIEEDEFSLESIEENSEESTAEISSPDDIVVTPQNIDEVRKQLLEIKSTKVR